MVTHGEEDLNLPERNCDWEEQEVEEEEDNRRLKLGFFDLNGEGAWKESGGGGEIREVVRGRRSSLRGRDELISPTTLSS